MQKILDELRAELPEVLAGGLGKPATERQFKCLVDKVGFDLYADAKQLFSWANGAKLTFMPEYYYLSITHAVAEYLHRPNLHQSKLFPLFTNGGGGFLVMRMRSRRGDNSGLYEVSQLDDGESLIFDSISTLVSAVSGAWRQKLFEVMDPPKGGIPFTNFSCWDSRKEWNVIFADYNKKAFKLRERVAPFVTKHALASNRYKRSELFSEDEFHGFSGTFPCPVMEIHWNEYLEFGVIRSKASKTDLQKERQWFDMCLPVFRGLVKRCGKKERISCAPGRLELQLAFLEGLRQAILEAK